MNEKVRISVANIVRVVSDCADYYETVVVGVLNPKKLAKGERFVQAIGGRANLTSIGKRILEENFGAEGFEPDVNNPGVYDAAFIAPAEHLGSILLFFEKDNPEYFETDPSREIREELYAKEYPGIGSVLPMSAPMPMVIYQSTVRQPAPADGMGTSSRARDDMPTRRIFRLFDLVFDMETFAQFVNSPAIVGLSEDDLATTNGGRSKGMTKSGDAIADNLGVEGWKGV